MRRPLLALAALSVAAAPAPADDLKAGIPDRTAAELPALVAALGDRDYKAREAAAKRLLAVGPPAVLALDAAAHSPVPEVARRAVELRARIAAAADNDAAVAARPVQFKAGEQKLGTLFMAIEQQTRFRVAVNGDQAVLSQAVAPPAGKLTFWEAVDGLCAAAGLEVEAARGPDGPVNAQNPNDAARRQLQQALRQRLETVRTEKDLASLRVQQLDLMISKADGDKKVRLEAERKDQAATVGKLDAQVAALVERIGPLDGTAPVGTVVLRARGTATAGPSDARGGARVAAAPVPDDARARIPEGEPAVLLSLTPEPRFRWGAVTEVLIGKAVDQDGRELSQLMLDPLAASYAMTDERLVMRRARLARNWNPDGLSVRTSVLPATPTQGWVRLIALPTGKSTKLKELSGVVKATAWTAEATDLACVSGLDAATAIDTGANGTVLSVRVVGPVKGDPAATLIEVEVRYDPARVALDAGTAPRPGDSPDAVWLGNGPGGKAVLLPPPNDGPSKPAAPDLRNPYGLRVTDAAGRPLRLSDTGSRVTHVSTDLGVRAVASLKYACRPATDEPTGAPARVAVRGLHLQTLSFPFRLTAVPVAVGTGTAAAVEPQPEVYYKR